MKRNLFVDTLASEILNLILEHDHASTGSKVTKDTFIGTMGEQDSFALCIFYFETTLQYKTITFFCIYYQVEM